MRYLTQSRHYSDLWRARHGDAPAYTFPQEQPTTRSMARLDYIWTSPVLTQLAVGVGVGIAEI